MGTYWEQNIKKIPTPSLLPKGEGKKWPLGYMLFTSLAPNNFYSYLYSFAIFGKGGGAGHELWELFFF
jgi:hypothetical protein